MHELKLFPWENDIKPDFVNDEGFEWYIHKDITKYAKTGKGGLKNVMCFYVKKDKDITYVLLNDRQQILHDTKKIEAMGAHIDALKLQNTFK